MGGEGATGPQELLRADPGDVQRIALHGWALAYLGRNDEAFREARRAVALKPVSKDVLVGPYVLELLAKTYAAGGETDKAIDTLEELLKAPSWVSARSIAIDPNYAALRGNPRFQKLIGKT